MKYLFYLPLLFVGLAFSCNSGSNKKKDSKLPDYNPVVSSFTNGVISRHASLTIELTHDVDSALRNNLAFDIVSVSPAVKGKITWDNARTLYFTPVSAFTPGKAYEVKVNLHKIIPNVDPAYHTFKFPIQIIQRDFEVIVNGIFSDSEDKKQYYLEGYIAFTDKERLPDVQALLKASYLNRELKPVWEQKAAGKTWNFTFSDIERKDVEQDLILEFNGKPIGIKKELTKKINIPGLESFRILNIQALHQENQYLVIEFSDPLDKKQELNGLVKVAGADKLRYVVEGNLLKVYSENRLSGEQIVTIQQEIRSAEGKTLASKHESAIEFEAIKPEIRFIGKGTIIPPSGRGARVNFETVNLKAVDLYVIRIYEQNVAQYLQSNRLDGNNENELVKTGRLIIKKKIDLVSERVLNYGKWNAFSFDISELINVEEGAIYRLELRMKQEYSTYPCAEDEVVLPKKNSNDNWKPKDSVEDWDDIRYWSTYRNYYYRDRDNPCTYSYYNYRSYSRNVLVSDLGILAKKDANQQLKVYVNSLISAQPIEGALVKILDYQGMEIANSLTTNDGFAGFSVSRKPYLAWVEKGKQRGYLRLDDNTALSYSNFDVGGEKVQKGIKGFIYGERGVWRPGDSIYVTFILEDKAQQLPANHPVEFTLTNPKGQITNRLVSTSGLNGFYPFHVKTQTSDPTGFWNATVRVGDATFSKRIRIETVKPNRLKIKLSVDENIIHSGDNNQTAYLNVKWLHGAAASEVKISSEISYLVAKTKFKGYYNYSFTDPSKEFTSIPETIFEGKTNRDGIASFPIKLTNPKRAPGMLNARFYTRAFEKGGDFSSNVSTIPYSPFSAYVGLKVPNKSQDQYYYETGKDYVFDIATVDEVGNPLSLKGIKVSVYKINWRWWWSSGSDNLGYYTGRNNYVSKLSKTLVTNVGKGKFKLNIDDNRWGRYFVKVELPNGHSTGTVVYFDWPYGNRKDGPGGATLLSFTSDKKAYEVGEEVYLNLPGDDGARALVSIENGSSIVKDFWVDLHEKQNRVNFKVKPEMAPNIFVNVVLIQPHANTQNDNPIRMYGIIPILVEDPETILKPQIEIPNVIEPEKTVSIKVKEERGRKMTYTLAIVEEGLLDLTNFKTPAPYTSFYAREAHGINTWDIYNDVTGAFGGTLEKIFAIGGDDALNEKSKKEANRFKPVVKYFGPYTLEEGKIAEHKFKMPRYIGAVRSMVIAGDKGKYGNVEESSQVKSSLMVLGTLPRVLSPDEKVKLPVTVFAVGENISEVKVTIKTSGGLSVIGEHIKEIEFTEEGEKTAYFDIAVGENLGIGKVQIEASSGGKTAKYDIELNIRYPLAEVTNAKTILIPAGEGLKEEYVMPGLPGTNSLQVDISTIPAINLSERLDYLIRYPYGCIEQTASSLFPQIYLPKLLDLSENKMEEIQKNVETGIRRIQNFQTSSGGFSYWQGGSEANDWGTSYAGHFLLEAEKMGYSIPSGLKKNWIKFQKKTANNFTNPFKTARSYRNKEAAQAYRLYTLALAGQPAYGAMNRLRNNQKLNKQTKWRLALAYAHAGRPETALELMDVRNLEVEDYTDMGYTYGSSFRDKAMLLETLITSKFEDEAFALVASLSKDLSSDKWLSTQETAWAIRSIAHFYTVHKPSSGHGKFTLRLDGGASLSGAVTGAVKSVPFVNVKEEETVHFENVGDDVLFVTLVGKGIPQVGSEVAASRQLAMKVEYVDENNLPIDFTSIKQGTDFLARVSVEYNGLNKKLDNIVLKQVFPSGWEILNARLFTGERDKKGVIPDYVDIRDDRVYTFFSITKGKKATFEIRLNASYAGRYYLPQVSVETMYSDKYYARNVGEWVEVTMHE